MNFFIGFATAFILLLPMFALVCKAEKTGDAESAKTLTGAQDTWED